MLPPEGRLPEYNIKDFSDTLYEPYLDEMIPPVWMDTAAIRKVAALQEQLTYYHRQKIAEWISGQANIDAEWDSYIVQLEKLVIKELLEINRRLIGNNRND
jgi:putative aldouronate transport system substrate-binding protein